MASSHYPKTCKNNKLAVTKSHSPLNPAARDVYTCSQGGEIDAAVPGRRPIILHVCLPILLAEKVYPLVHIMISTRDWLIDSGYLVESDAILSSDGRNGKDTLPH